MPREPHPTRLLKETVIGPRPRLWRGLLWSHLLRSLCRGGSGHLWLLGRTIRARWTRHRRVSHLRWRLWDRRSCAWHWWQGLAGAWGRRLPLLLHATWRSRRMRATIAATTPSQSAHYRKLRSTGRRCAPDERGEQSCHHADSDNEWLGMGFC